MDKAMHSEFEGSTPGPWAPDEEQYCQYVFGPDGEMICEMRGWGYLTGNRRNLSEEDALKIQSLNCRLVAAAPDLLKENQSLRSELQKQKELNAELVKGLVKTEKAFQDSCNNYADWLPTQELIHAITLIESLIKKYKES